MMIKHKSNIEKYPEKTAWKAKVDQEIDWQIYKQTDKSHTYSFLDHLKTKFYRTYFY